jgi:hypothetical protein
MVMGAKEDLAAETAALAEEVRGLREEVRRLREGHLPHVCAPAPYWPHYCWPYGTWPWPGTYTICNQPAGMTLCTSTVAADTVTATLPEWQQVSTVCNT